MAKTRTCTSKITKRTSWEVPAMEIQILGKEPIPSLEISANTIKIMDNICKTIQINKIPRSWTNPLQWIKPLRAF